MKVPSPEIPPFFPGAEPDQRYPFFCPPSRGKWPTIARQKGAILLEKIEGGSLRFVPFRQNGSPMRITLPTIGRRGPKKSGQNALPCSTLRPQPPPKLTTRLQKTVCKLPTIFSADNPLKSKIICH
jgi:hypothetical protein